MARLFWGAEMNDSSVAMLATILLVDDTPENLVVLGELLRPHYRVRVASSGQRALDVAATAPRPDLILLDVMMPGMDGYATLRALRQDPSAADIPVIFVTAMDSIQDEEYGLSLGAVDYITKPVRPAIVLARVRAQLELKQARDWLKDRNTVLEAEVTRRMGENQLIQDVSIQALARLAETRDPETGNHLSRTQGYVRALATKLRGHPRFAGLLTERYIDLLVKSAPLHDIGKVGIPDHILLKPGKLDPDEWVIMKTHAKMGSDAIEHAEEDSEHPVEFLILAKEIAHWHHERWDGSGYPDGLVGEAIPLSARLMTLADVFDALISRRCYKEPIAMDETRRIILAERGRQFDPDVTDAFEAIFDEFLDIAGRYNDGDGRLKS
jgi:putative two-component system response regulator